MAAALRPLALALGLALAAPAAAALPLQSPLPDAAWPDLEGHTVRLPALAGKPTLINVWATWCPPCIAELPVLAELHRAYAAAGLQVVGINIDVDLGTVEAAVAKHGIPYRVLHDAAGTSSRPFRLDQVPASFLFDAEGRLVWQTEDELKPGDPALRAALKRVLPAAAPKTTPAPETAPRARPDGRLWPPVIPK